jgi:hypothetical protein
MLALNYVALEAAQHIHRHPDAATLSKGLFAGIDAQPKSETKRNARAWFNLPDGT